MKTNLTGAEIRKSFIEFFVARGHTFVQSSSLVPGGDQTLLFTNAGMVQFKDVFLGTDRRPYTRAANSQKCLRVAGKHNDLDEVGRDTYHHTFFEMLGNWSFGDYYKEDAIRWAWELLTDVWGLNKDLLWTTYFVDDKGDIPSDSEAAAIWRRQPGINPEHVVKGGRKDNFWEMADTGPCGPCSEINIDLGPEYCDRKNEPGHICEVNGNCLRYRELWNLVFIQYNRLSPTQLDPLPATHVDTGMGLERIVSVLQGVTSNYATDLLSPILDKVQELTGQTDQERAENITSYRVLADHSRAATFLIADGVVPGNTGRNYICRMIIRRAARFASKIGFTEPFMAKLARVVIDHYGEAYPELIKNQKAILDNLTREEDRFQRTVEAGIKYLDDVLAGIAQKGEEVLDGHEAFNLYATHGLPLELTRDIAREKGLDVDEIGFRTAMEEHRIASGSGKAFGAMGGEDVEIYRTIVEGLEQIGKLPSSGVVNDPYTRDVDGTPRATGEVLALFKDGIAVDFVNVGDQVEVVLPRTPFYIESGGQVADSGVIYSTEHPWRIRVDDVRRPAAGVIVHVGEVISGTPSVGEVVFAEVDLARRRDIMRNHTATHLLHAELHKILGEHARQAGSLVAPDRLRFDFTHPSAITPEQLELIEAGVNRNILENYPLNIVTKSLSSAMEEGATALFGEKYGETVRTITIGEPERISYELCGGTHVDETGDIGLFIITSEGSAAAGVRRIEAVTGRRAYELVQHRSQLLKRTASTFNCSIDEIPQKAENCLDEIDRTRKQVQKLRQEISTSDFENRLGDAIQVDGTAVLACLIADSDADILRQMTDQFKQRYPSGVVVLGSIIEGKPMLIAAVTDDLIKRGISAGELVKNIAQVIGGSGGGRPNLAQAGGKDTAKLSDALDQVIPWVKKKLG